jgi:hypothetical protein
MSKYADFSTRAFMSARLQRTTGDWKRFNDANELLQKLTLKGMEDAVPLFYEVCRRYKDQFAEDLEEGDLHEYLERQTLNFMQGVVEICLPGYAEPRALAWLANDIRLKGFAKDVETYLRVHGGLTLALAKARRSLNSRTCSSMFAEEGDIS